LPDKDLVDLCPPIEPYQVTKNRVYYGLRKKGNPIPTNDMWIAATALQYNLALFSYDKHFQAIDGLKTGSGIADFKIVRSE